MLEVWKDIQGYEGLYQVSNLGNIKSLQGNKEKLLALCIQRGYARVNLWKDKRRKTKKVHRIVAEAFIPNPHNKPFINHIDHNRSNNCVWNLEWCTQKENMAHAVKFDRVCKGRDCHSSVLTEEDVRDIRELSSILYQRELGTIFGVSKTTIGKILRGVMWKHVA